MSTIHVDVASRAPHSRKHGASFADSFQAADGSTIIVLGEVVAGIDRSAVGDLLRAGSRALIPSRQGFDTALLALDRVVQRHAHEHRDSELAAVIALIGIAPDAGSLEFAGAGQLHCAILRALGDERTHLHGHAAALGTTLPKHETFTQSFKLHHGDVVIAATIPVDPSWLESRRAETILHAAGAHEASAALVTFD